METLVLDKSFVPKVMDEVGEELVLVEKEASFGG